MTRSERLFAAAALASLALVAQSGFAAELRGDSILLCDALREPSAALRPAGALLELSADMASRDFAAAYGKLADLLAAALRPGERAMPGVERFLANLRNGNALPFQFFAVNPVRRENAEKLFEAHPDQISIPCAAVPRYLVDVSAASLIAFRVGERKDLPLLAERALAVAQRSQEAEELLNKGLPMWPWETWANGLRLSSQDSDPLFRTQWVLLRPTAGMEVDTRNRASADLQASVAIEPLGFVRYRGEGYTHWWGASLVVTSSTRRGAGVGALLRWDNYVLGLTRHKGDAGLPDSNFLLVGIDLYDFLNKKRADLKDWDAFREKRTQGLLDALGGR
jgi:hypothetical protein